VRTGAPAPARPRRRAGRDEAVRRPSPVRRRLASPALAGLFAATGFAGLVYEVAWTRLLVSLFGASSLAVSAVLSAFMAGLTLGSLALGRWIDRARVHPLLVFALLEAATALYALVLPGLVAAATGAYAPLYRALLDAPAVLGPVRFLIALALLLPPTVLMGGTLPVLSRYLIRRDDEIGWGIGLLYGVNTFGAALGCFAAGFLLIEALGVGGAARAAATLQLALAGLVAGVVVRSAWSLPPTEPARTESAPPAVGRRRGRSVSPGAPLGRSGWALVAIGVSGFAALGYEVVWSRLLAFFLGNTVYAFSAMLTTLLAGLALGSVLGGLGLRRAGAPLLALGLVEVALGLAALATVPLLDWLNALRLGLGNLLGGLGWWQLTATKFVLAAAVLLPPSLAMGAAFPLAGRLWTRDVAGTGRGIGTVYAANALCGALGAFVAGFVLVPTLGAQRSVVVLAGLNVLVGAGLAWLAARGLAGRVSALGGVAAALALGLALPPDRPTISIAGLPQGTTAPYRLVAYREGTSASVGVLEDATGVRELSINGVSTAFTSTWDMRIHKLLAQLPLLLHPDPRRVLVVGLGMGVTVHSSLGHAGVERVDVAEISPEVAAVQPRFRAVAGDPLSDPKLRLILDDGKSYLQGTAERYDVVTSNAIHPGVAAGNSALYTVDFYRAARDRLNPGGLVCQWLPIHQLSTDDLRTLVASFAAVFPETTVWFASDFALLVGGDRPLAVDRETLARRLDARGAREDLAALGDLRSDDPALLAGYYMIGPEALAALAAGARLHTDDDPVIEFRAPRSAHLSGETNLANLRLLEAHRQPLPGSSADVRRFYDSGTDLIAGQIAFYAGDRDAAEARYRAALASNPADVDARYLLKRLLTMRAVEADRAGRRDAAIDRLTETLALDPGFAEGEYRLAVVLDKAGRSAEALPHLERAVALNATHARWRVDLAAAYFGRGRAADAERELLNAVAADPTFAEARVHLAALYRRLGREEEARAQLRAAEEVRPAFR
jgi:spermidine synthase